jgi:sugar fermentation stimulation protein A
MARQLKQKLAGYGTVRSEVTVRKGTRLDLALEEPGRRNCYVEIKNCTLVVDGTAMFPDAVTVRGQKHLDELKDLKKTGHRSVIFFLIQRMDAKRFSPAAGIDPAYARKLLQAGEHGVEIITRDVVIDLAQIRVHQSLPVRL